MVQEYGQVIQQYSRGVGFFSRTGNFLIEMADVKPLARLSRGASFRIENRGDVGK
jgi:hypothetical protein